MGTKVLELSMGKDLGALKGLNQEPCRENTVLLDVPKPGGGYPKNSGRWSLPVSLPVIASTLSMSPPYAAEISAAKSSSSVMSRKSAATLRL